MWPPPLPADARAPTEGRPRAEAVPSAAPYSWVKESEAVVAASQRLVAVGVPSSTELLPPHALKHRAARAALHRPEPPTASVNLRERCAEGVAAEPRAPGPAAAASTPVGEAARLQRPTTCAARGAPTGPGKPTELDHLVALGQMFGVHAALRGEAVHKRAHVLDAGGIDGARHRRHHSGMVPSAWR